MDTNTLRKTMRSTIKPMAVLTPTHFWFALVGLGLTMLVIGLAAVPTR